MENRDRRMSFVSFDAILGATRAEGRCDRRVASLLFELASNVNSAKRFRVEKKYFGGRSMIYGWMVPRRPCCHKKCHIFTELAEFPLSYRNWLRCARICGPAFRNAIFLVLLGEGYRGSRTFWYKRRHKIWNEIFPPPLKYERFVDHLTKEKHFSFVQLLITYVFTKLLL